MFKKITIILAVLALLLSAFYGIILLKQRGKEQVPTPTPTTITPDGNSLYLPDRTSDTPLLVPNFLSPAASVKPLQVIEDTVSGSQTALLKRAENYSLYGFTGSDGTSFMVALHADNLRQARIDGEQALLGILGINQEQACSTNITVVVQSPYDYQVTVTDVRPSFCPDRVDLPESGASQGAVGETIERGAPDTSL